MFFIIVKAHLWKFMLRSSCAVCAVDPWGSHMTIYTNFYLLCMWQSRYFYAKEKIIFIILHAIISIVNAWYTFYFFLTRWHLVVAKDACQRKNRRCSFCVHRSLMQETDRKSISKHLIPTHSYIPVGGMYLWWMVAVGFIWAWMWSNAKTQTICFSPEI